MICPNCKSEQAETAKFCSQCATSLAQTGQSTVVVMQSQTPKWLAVIFVILLGFVALAIRQQNERPRRTATPAATPGSLVDPSRPQLHSINLTNGAATVNANAYVWYTFVVPVGANSATVNGHFSATGGMGNDIECYILDADGFANFKNRHAAPSYFNSGKVTQSQIAAANLSAGTYYLMLDNRFSLLAPKAVQIQAMLTYLQ